MFSPPLHSSLLLITFVAFVFIKVLRMSALVFTSSAKGSVIDFCRSPSEIQQEVTCLLAKERALLNSVAAEASPTFANTVARINHMDDEHESCYSVFQVLGELSPSQNIQTAAKKATHLVHEFTVECSMRADIYKQVLAVSSNAKEMDGLCSEDKLLVERMVNGYCRSGLLLGEDKRNRLCDIESQLAKTVAEFTANISNDASKLLFTRNELSGLPATFFADKPLVTTNGVEKYVICVTKPNSMLVLRLATLEETRKAMYVALFTKCPNNIELLQQAVDLRQEKAKILGFKSHASYTLDDLSMNNPDMVLDMLNTLRTQLTPMARRELAQLRAIKQADCESKGLEFTDFYDWDLAYYKRTKTECTHNIDSTLIKSYFHVPDVVCRLFALFEEIMQLRFCKVDASVWHPLVELYEVWDTNGFVGHCYLDLYARPRKYANGATFHIRSGFTRKTGAREYPAVALVTNFVQPTNGEPALLSHANLKTLVHEMGHVLHNLCSVTKWSMFHGTRVCRDFVECPSQMLENLIWTPSVLQKLGVHYQTKQPIPLCIVDAIIAAKPQVAGVFYLQKLFYAVYDISIYHSPSLHVDASLVYNTLEKNVALCNTGGIETIGAATTRQVVRGYDSKCFVYLWGQALAADMFSTRFGRDGVFNQQTWMEYRNVILRPGGSTDIMNCVHQFLGRKPQYNAFFTQIGLD